MYNNVFPIVTETRCPTEFTKYQAFKEAVTSVKKSFIRANMRSERMTYNQRLDKILKLEEAQGMLFDFAIEQRRAFEKFHDHENIRQIDKLIIKLAQYSTIRVGVNTYGDWVINTPLLGLSRNNISAIVHKTVNFAVLALKVGNVRVPQIKQGCVLVKTYGDISKMDHSTLENRELHAITDALMGINDTDDNPENFNFMYSWANSNTPGVQIVICTVERAALYKSMMLDFGSKDGWPLESQTTRKRKTQVITAFNVLDDIFEKYPRLALDTVFVTDKQIDCLAGIMRRLTVLNTALRNPSIFPKDHLSDYYTKGREPKDKDYKDLYDPDALGEFEFDKESASLIAYCDRFDSFYNRGGKVLQDFLNCGLWQYSAWYSSEILAAAKDNAPMAISVERCLTEEEDSDNDNINVMGINYDIFKSGRVIYTFKDNLMLIKVKTVSEPTWDYRHFPSKIVLCNANNITMDFYP